MGEVIQFVSKYERDLDRLIRIARARYDSIFPPADPVGEERDKALNTLPVSGATVHSGDADLLS